MMLPQADDTASVEPYGGGGVKVVDNGLKWTSNQRNTYSRFDGFASRLKNLPRDQGQVNSQLSQLRKNILPGVNLQLYNQWAATDPTPKLTMQEVYASHMKNPNSNVYSQLQKTIGAENIKYDQQLEKWVGPIVSNFQQKVNNRQRNTLKSLIKANYLVKKVQPQQWVNAQTPHAISDIVQSSQALHVSGFGAKKKNGLGLYVGRWADPKTGRVRLLPKASRKLLNPASYQQALAYRQARLLNKWNGVVEQIQNLDNFRSNVNPQQYAKNIKQKIVTKLNQTGNYTSLKQQLDFIKKIQRIILQRYSQTIRSNNPYRYIVPQIASSYQNMAQFMALSSRSSDSNIKKGLQNWDNFIRYQIYPIIRSDNPQSDMATRTKMLKAVNSLIYSSISRLTPTFVKALKIKTLPMTPTNNISELIQQQKDIKSKALKINQRLATSTRSIKQMSSIIKQLSDDNFTGFNAQLRSFQPGYVKPTQQTQTKAKMQEYSQKQAQKIKVNQIINTARNNKVLYSGQPVSFARDYAPKKPVLTGVQNGIPVYLDNNVKYTLSDPSAPNNPIIVFVGQYYAAAIFLYDKNFIKKYADLYVDMFAVNTLPRNMITLTDQITSRIRGRNVKDNIQNVLRNYPLWQMGPVLAIICTLLLNAVNSRLTMSQLLDIGIPILKQTVEEQARASIYRMFVAAGAGTPMSELQINFYNGAYSQPVTSQQRAAFAFQPALNDAITKEMQTQLTPMTRKTAINLLAKPQIAASSFPWDMFSSTEEIQKMLDKVAQQKLAQDHD